MRWVCIGVCLVSSSACGSITWPPYNDKPSELRHDKPDATLITHAQGPGPIRAMSAEMDAATARSVCSQGDIETECRADAATAQVDAGGANPAPGRDAATAAPGMAGSSSVPDEQKPEDCKTCEARLHCTDPAGATCGAAQLAGETLQPATDGAKSRVAIYHHILDCFLDGRANILCFCNRDGSAGTCTPGCRDLINLGSEWLSADQEGGHGCPLETTPTGRALDVINSCYSQYCSKECAWQIRARPIDGGLNEDAGTLDPSAVSATCRACGVGLPTCWQSRDCRKFVLACNNETDQNCPAVLACMRRTRCATASATDCLCGDVPTETCFDGGSTKLRGACGNEIALRARARDAVALQALWSDEFSGFNTAKKVIECDRSLCADQCGLQSVTP